MPNIAAPPSPISVLPRVPPPRPLPPSCAFLCCFDLGSRPCSCDHASLAMRLAPESEERGVSLSIAMSASGGRLPNSTHGKPTVSIHRRVAVSCFVFRPRLERPSGISVAAVYASRSSASMSMSSLRDDGATTVLPASLDPAPAVGALGLAALIAPMTPHDLLFLLNKPVAGVNASRRRS
jgi:hypothetical protein